MSNLVILNWQPFEYKAKFEKRPLSFRSEIGIFDIFFKRVGIKKVLKICKSIVIENFKSVPLCSIKWWPFKVFVKIHKSPLLLAYVDKGLRSETIFGNWKPLKIEEKHFLLTLFVLKIFKFLSCRKNGFIRKKRLISKFMASQLG